MARGILNRLKKWSPNTTLRNFRQAQGLSQAKLAAQVGTHQSVIARQETGEARANVPLLAKVASVLGRDLRDLVPVPDGAQLEEPSGPDDEIMRRALRVGRRFSAGDDELTVGITGLVYSLLMDEREGHPISDDERTLSRIDDFLRRLRRSGPS